MKPVFACLRSLGGSPADALEQASKRIAERGHRFRLELRLLGEPRELVAGDGKRLRLITRAETWQAIADGAISPYEAFTTGKLRFRGQMEDAIEALRALRAPGGRIALCVED